MKKPDLEKTIARIQEIAKEMQREDLSIDQSIELVREANALFESARDYLNQAELKLTRLDDGK